MKISSILVPLCAFSCSGAIAQSAPTAGSLQQQIERQQAPLPTAVAPVIRVEQGMPAATPADGRAIRIARVRFSGARAFSDATLAALAGVGTPRLLTLADLRAMAARVTDFYHQHGYFVAQAYLPAQDIVDGSVTIAVLEGHYGQISLRNSSPVSDGLLAKLLSGLHQGDAVAIEGLESGLLQIADVPGAEVKSTLVPGASVGASDLIVEVMPGQRVSGSVDADNYGNRYTGGTRAGAALYLNNLAGHGDLLSLRALTSNDGLRYARAAWQAQFGRAKAGVAYSHMRYRLGEDFSALQAHGTASIASLFASYPLLRSRSHNLNALASVDAKRFRDEADVAATSAAKKATVGLLGLNGNARDGIGGGAVSSFALAWYSGELALQGSAALATDAASVRSNGHFNKLSLQLTRLQELGPHAALYAALNVQLSNDNLDTSEKIGLGGGSGVRAYPSGEAFGDQGHVLNLELRVPLPQGLNMLPGQVQLVGFVDHGSVLLNRNPWTSGQNRRTLSAAGIGFNWELHKRFSVNLSVARKLGNEVATSAPDARHRLWFEATKYF